MRKRLRQNTNFPYFLVDREYFNDSNLIGPTNLPGESKMSPETKMLTRYIWLYRELYPKKPKTPPPKYPEVRSFDISRAFGIGPTRPESDPDPGYNTSYNSF